MDSCWVARRRSDGRQVLALISRMSPDRRLTDAVEVLAGEKIVWCPEAVIFEGDRLPPDVVQIARFDQGSIPDVEAIEHWHRTGRPLDSTRDAEDLSDD